MTVTASSFVGRPNDLYETEPWAVDALVRAVPDFGDAGARIWDPAAGNHAILDLFRARGQVTLASDIETYDREHDFEADFLWPSPKSGGLWSVVTNPPYGKSNRLAVAFVERALLVCPNWVAMLLTAKFDFGKTRTHLLRDEPRFFGKVALLDRISWVGNGQTGTEDHAWFVWGPASWAPFLPKMFWEARK
ncbi:MAG: hypothetical protein KDJ19_00600 [Hyphomicrobiaceae bacterium]|nr:hypothetical protein [Hyphomicrobiaceae bacterium]MCC0024606.1 hypothetical protein [Hyphomicrobiaceae bacterium]